MLALWCIVALPRIGLTLLAAPELGVDEQTYWEIARNYETTGTYKSERDLATYGLEQVRPPLVPWVLWGLFKLVGHSVMPLRLIFACLSALVVFPLYLLLRRLDVPDARAQIAAVLASLHPYLVLNGSRLLTESLFPVLGICAIANMASWRRSSSILPSVAGGFWLGLAALCRPTLVPFLPLLLLVWLFFAKGRHRWWGIIAVVSAALVLAPWTLSLHRKYDAWIPITTSGSYNLWNANNPHMKPGVMATELTPQMKTELAALTEQQRIRYFRELAQNWATNHPKEFWIARWTNLAAFWKLFPEDLWNREHSFDEGYLVKGPRQWIVVTAKIAWFGGLNLVLIAFVIESAKLLKTHRPELLSILACLAAITAVHTLMTGYARYRYPIDPLWTAVGTSGILRFFVDGPRWSRRIQASAEQNMES